MGIDWNMFAFGATNEYGKQRNAYARFVLSGLHPEQLEF